MTKTQYKRLVKTVTHMEIDDLLYVVSKPLSGDIVLVAECLEDDIGIEIQFSEEALMSGEVDKDGEVYIAEMGDSTDCQFYPLTMCNIF